MKYRVRMPAEWEPHEATWLSWPWNKGHWPGKVLDEVQETYLEMMAALLPGENVNVLIPERRTASAILKKMRRVKARTSGLVFHQVKTADIWIRDYGPIFVRKIGKLAAKHEYVIPRSTATRDRTNGASNRFSFDSSSTVSQSPRNDIEPPSAIRHPSSNAPIIMTKWQFNAWGGKYRDIIKDNGVVDRVGALSVFQRLDVPFVFEGGSIDVNGRGAALTTRQCLCHPNRGRYFSREMIAAVLRDHLGISDLLWLSAGIAGDDTDGHVDDIARFVNPRTILVAGEPDKTDINHRPLNENLELLKKANKTRRRRFDIVELPMPGRIMNRGTGKRLPASYANFYIGNRAVLVPVYGSNNDNVALKIIGSFFPQRRVIGIRCDKLIHGFGAIHCITQQQPA